MDMMARLPTVDQTTLTPFVRQAVGSESAALIDRREHELRLLHSYHTLLLDNGVRDYPFERCWEEYRLAMLPCIARMIAVIGAGVVPPEQERGFCEVLIPRYCRAAHDLKVGDLVTADRSRYR